MTLLQRLLVTCLSLLLYASTASAQNRTHAIPGTRVTLSIPADFSAIPGSSMLGNKDGIVLMAMPAVSFESEAADIRDPAKQKTMGLREFTVTERPLAPLRRLFGVGFGAEPSGDFRKHVLILSDTRGAYAVLGFVATAKYTIDPAFYDKSITTILDSVRLSENEAVMAKAFSITMPPGGFQAVGAPGGRMQVFAASDGKTIVAVMMDSRAPSEGMDVLANRAFQGGVNNIALDAQFGPPRREKRGAIEIYEREFSGVNKMGQTSHGVARLQTDAKNTYILFFLAATPLTDAQREQIKRSFESVKEAP